MIEVDLRGFPRVVEVSVDDAIVLVVDEIDADEFTRSVDTRLEPTTEQIDAHDTEDEPKHETDEQYVEDGRNRLD